MGTYITVVERDPALGDVTPDEFDAAVREWRTDVLTAGHEPLPPFPVNVRVAADLTSIRCEGRYADE